MELIKVAINDLDILKTKLQNFQTPFVATIGVFDGMHLYHQKILKKTKQ
jgi:riboflavin kinase/FMN adenylyltransferase